MYYFPVFYEPSKLKSSQDVILLWRAQLPQLSPFPRQSTMQLFSSTVSYLYSYLLLFFKIKWYWWLVGIKSSGLATTPLMIFYVGSYFMLIVPTLNYKILGVNCEILQIVLEGKTFKKRTRG